MSLNKVILIGNVGKDPDVRYFDNNKAVANFPLATNERGYKLQDGTEIPERTEWHNIVVRRDRVQFVEKWVKKGSGLYIEGKLRSRNYDDKDGVKRYITEIIADRVEFYSAGTRPEGEAAKQQPQPPTVAPTQQPTPPPEAIPPAPEPVDDLPF